MRRWRSRPLPLDVGYEPLSGDGFLLLRTLREWRTNPPTTRSAAHESARYGETWTVELCFDKNRVRFDFEDRIRALDKHTTLEDAWRQAARGYQKSVKARLAFELQFLAIQAERPHKMRVYRGDDGRPVPPKRPIQTDGPKRRRFKKRDRHDIGYARCTCAWCRPTTARGTERVRALKDQDAGF